MRGVLWVNSFSAFGVIKCFVVDGKYESFAMIGEQGFFVVQREMKTGYDLEGGDK